MMIPCNYSICISKDTHREYGRYVHYCRIELSETMNTDAMKKFKEIATIFGDGYKMTLEYNECHGENVLESTNGKIEPL